MYEKRLENEAQHISELKAELNGVRQQCRRLREDESRMKAALKDALAKV